MRNSHAREVGEKNDAVGKICVVIIEPKKGQELQYNKDTST